MVEGARLESEYTAKPYRGFESLPLRHLTFQPHPTVSGIAENSQLSGLMSPALKAALAAFETGEGPATFSFFAHHHVNYS